MMISGKSALIAGATGLVGSELVRYLLERPVYSKVVLLVRRPLPLEHPKLVQQVVDFDHLDEHAELFQVDDVFCCLGTTIKIAKTRERFQKVDLEYPLALARMAQAAGVGQFLIITAMGSDPHSRIFYNRTKGLTEDGLQALNLPSLQIFRPSLLLGDRQEFRFGEKVGAVVMQALGGLMVGSLRKYRGIQARAVAFAMYLTAQKNLSGVYVYESDRIAEIAARGQ